MSHAQKRCRWWSAMDLRLRRWESLSLIHVGCCCCCCCCCNIREKTLICKICCFCVATNLSPSRYKPFLSARVFLLVNFNKLRWVHFSQSRYVTFFTYNLFNISTFFRSSIFPNLNLDANPETLKNIILSQYRKWNIAIFMILCLYLRTCFTCKKFFFNIYKIRFNPLVLNWGQIRFWTSKIKSDD